MAGHTATKKPVPGRDRLVPPYRFSMLDRGRPTEYSVGCSRGRLRTVPIPEWCMNLINAWLRDSGVTGGRIFRRISKHGPQLEAGVTTDVVWSAVKRHAKRIGIDHLAPHDLRRTCARLCHDSGGELEQIQFLLGHASVQTAER